MGDEFAIQQGCERGRLQLRLDGNSEIGATVGSGVALAMRVGSNERPKSLPAINFVKILSDEEAFDILYCIAFQLMDAQWLAMDASYMQFKEVLEATRIQLGRELALDDVRRIQDLPAYNLLYK
ncbi:hypothetical protein OPV22_028984 [Ensete ventricosum]|uniref:ELMO domain-containing protein n=1 Tax=Ensete ventricosum TaxID=4639 RepID=A0AAV8PZW7_ENSVE|nr:hypothetical protein OPV22_028984 [Ensete ventricosum]